MYIHINGKIMKAGEARLSPFEHGFMYGLGLFETFRVYENHPFLLDDHFRRLEEGLAMMNIRWTYERSSVEEEINLLLNANNLQNAYVRYNISAGEQDLGLTTSQYHNPTKIIYMKPLTPPVSSLTKKGVILSTSRNTPEADIRLKSHHYFNSILGKRELGDHPDEEGIFLTREGYIAEGVVSNIFWLKQGTLYTPSVDTGILNGITRQFVMTLARKLGYYIRTGRFSLDHLLSADAAFVTNSIQEIVPLSEIDERKFKKSEDITRLKAHYASFREKLWSRQEI
ncbi:aminodeoxychorismate lyase [Thalassorhabdus alkalitolerans]|uniref:Aminodeoxychorismate lyase n=1 Tax=Thalassorhabdus alkalitolerans TaxID=2282697 RepID=A0ABW0YQS2_9BACI